MNTKTISLYLAMIAGVILSGYFGPWWAPAAFIVLLSGLMQLSARKAGIAGGLSIGVVYLVMAIWMKSMDKADIIGKTGLLLGGLSPIGLMIVTTFIGAITGILSGWIGATLGAMLMKKGEG